MMAWVNTGLGLPLDGSLDLDISHLAFGLKNQAFHAGLRPEWKTQELRRLWKLVPNPRGHIEVVIPPTPKSMELDLSVLKLTTVPVLGTDAQNLALTAEVSAWNERWTRGYRIDFERDLTVRSNPMPSHRFMLEPMDVKVMELLYAKRWPNNDEGVRYLYTKLLGMNKYDRFGTIEISASTPPLYDWAAVPVTSGRCIAVHGKVDAINEIVRAAEEARSGIQPKPNLTYDTAKDEVRQKREWLWRSLQIYASTTSCAKWSPIFFERTLWKPRGHSPMSMHHLDLLNEPRRKGLEMGTSALSMEGWYDVMVNQVTKSIVGMNATKRDLAQYG